MADVNPADVDGTYAGRWVLMRVPGFHRPLPKMKPLAPGVPLYNGPWPPWSPIVTVKYYPAGETRGGVKVHAHYRIISTDSGIDCNPQICTEHELCAQLAKWRAKPLDGQPVVRDV